MVDLHRHDEFSLFDGFGKAKELAELAKELGHTSFASSNHGNTNGLVKTWEAGIETGIKPILGIEGYFLPKYKEQSRGFHLCLFAKNLSGYENINKIQYEGEKQKYYNPIWDFSILEKYSDGIICTSACVASYSAQCIINNQIEKAEKYLAKMKEIFDDDFYIEIQPYKITEKSVQEKVNFELIKLAKKLDIKCILTSDSHRGRKEDFDTYLKMHEIAGHDLNSISETYKERYMPTEQEIMHRFIKMHEADFGHKKAYVLAQYMVDNLEDIESKIDGNIFENNVCTLPPFAETEEKSYKLLVQKVKEGLKLRGKINDRKYVDRCKEELDVIKSLNFSSYFLTVADYTQWAKDNGIVVGAGRGSGCNSEVCYALGITDVDSLKYNLDFRRFLRKDKKKMPDIDLDFETSRRQEVIKYLVEKYDGHAAQICSYGMYKVDNLINDLAKVCGLNTTGKQEETEKQVKKQTIAEIKNYINNYADEKDIDFEGLKNDTLYSFYNKQYDNIIKHFTKLYMKVRYIGTHAAGVAITGDNLFKYTSIRLDKDGKKYVSYDLDDLDKIKIIKFDILGLNTMESLGELRKLTGNNFSDKITDDKKIMEHFREADTDGIFQFEKSAAKKILKNISCDCFEDVIAVNAMNRPGPLSLHMPEAYAENKFNEAEAKKSIYYKYTKETYGTLIYQEQIQQIAVNIGGLSWDEADKIMKALKGNGAGSVALKKALEASGDLKAKFISGAVKNGFKKSDAADVFDKLLVYSFNKGHGAGYSLISVEEMFYKVYYPTEFWYVKLKYAKDDAERENFSAKAVSSGCVVFLPHVNLSKTKTSLRKQDGENAIQQGLSELKGVGEKAADFIIEERKKNGKFKSYDDFYDRCKSRTVTDRVINILKEMGALEFKKEIYYKRVKKYNSALYMRGMQK